MTDKCSKIREIPTPVCALARNDMVFRHAEQYTSVYCYFSIFGVKALPILRIRSCLFPMLSPTIYSQSKEVDPGDSKGKNSGIEASGKAGAAS